MLSFLSLIIRKIYIFFAIIIYFLLMWNEPLKKKMNKVNVDRAWEKSMWFIKTSNYCAGIKLKLVNAPAKVENVVYVSNHGSIMDGTVVAEACGDQIRAILAGEEWYVKIPFFTTTTINAGHILVDRTSVKKSIQSLHELKKQAAMGNPVLVFPEGVVTDRTNGEFVNDFKNGAFKVANDLKLPIVPIACIGLAKKFPELITAGMLFQKNTTATINFFEPYTKHIQQKMTNQEIADDIKKIIEKFVKEFDQ